MLEDERDNFEKSNNRSIEEDWYRRTVEMNFKDPSKFIYSVPFETSGILNIFIFQLLLELLMIDLYISYTCIY